MLVGTTLLCSEARRAQARAAIDIYINPELSSVGLLDWKSFDATMELGYREAVEVLSRIDPEELAPYLDGDAIRADSASSCPGKPLSRNSASSLTSAAVAAPSR
jgi:predicted acylesterase/phospholipase RssA